MNRLFFILLFVLTIQCFSQELSVEHFDAAASTSYTNQLPYQVYDFSSPVDAEVLQTPGSRSSAGGGKGDFFFSVYGPRYLSGFDFHGGADLTPRVIVDGINYSDENTPDLLCMCDGEIVEVFDSWNETFGIAVRGNGNTIKVKCDQEFGTESDSWGAVYLAYRHMGEIADLSLGSRVSKGAVVGKLGETGASGNAHLHFSLQRCSDPDGDCEDGDAKFENVHPMRVFDPDAASHVHDAFREGEVFIELLEELPTQSIFRLAFLHNQVAIHSIEVNYNGANHASYVLEDVFEEANNAGDLDNPCFEENICVYANPFNRYSSAFERYLDFTDGGSNDLPFDFPSNPDHPILNNYPYNTPAFVLDVIVSNLPSGLDPSLLSIEVRDIYGNGAKAIASDFLLKTISDGDWNSASTWEGGIVPSENDRIEINHNVTLDGTNADLKSVVVSSSSSTHASLTISGGSIMNVSGYLRVIGSDEDRNTFLKISDDNTSLVVQNDLVLKRYHDSDQVYFEMDDNSRLEVGGNLLFVADEYSKESGSSSQSPSLNIGTVSGDPRLTIRGNLTINYGVEADKDVVAQIGRLSQPWNAPAVFVQGDASLSSNIGESGNTVTGLRLYANSILDVEGTLDMDYNPSFLETRHDVVFEMHNNSTATVSKLVMNSSLTNTEVNNSIMVNDDSKLKIDDALALAVAENEDENQFAINDQSTFELSGSLEGGGNGSLSVSSSSRMIFSGNQAITIPPTEDSFGTLEISGTATTPVEVSSDINVENQLILQNNILDLGSNSLVLSENATLDVSESGFIDGKIEQTIRPGHIGEEFNYPVGDGGTRAPVKILTTTTASQTIEIEYRKHSSIYDIQRPLVELGTGFWNINPSQTVAVSFGWTSSCDENIASVSKDNDRSLYLAVLANEQWQQVETSNIVDGSEACDDQDDDEESGYLSTVNFGNNVFSIGKTKSENRLPVLKSIADQQVDEAEEFRLTLEATDEDNQALTYRIDNESEAKGMRMDLMTGAFSWSPGESDDGEHFVGVVVSDGFGTASGSFRIVVQEVNDLPVIDQINDKEAIGGRELSFSASVTDSDIPVQKLTFSLDVDSGSKGMSIDANSGLFRWVPDNNQTGNHEVSIVVSDGVDQSSETFIVSVAEGAVLNIGEQSDLRLYPNPFEDGINIRNEDGVINRIDLINSAGQLVFSVADKNDVITIDTKELNRGIYIMRLFDGNERQIEMRKIVKK